MKSGGLHGPTHFAFRAIRHQLATRLQHHAHPVHGFRRPQLRLRCRRESIEQDHVELLFLQLKLKQPLGQPLKRQNFIVPTP